MATDFSKQGKRNGNWKGGITEGVRLFRKSRRYQQWRRIVLKRDNYACQLCGITPSNHVHHLVSIKQDPSLRFFVENGITVCLSCHNKIHKKRSGLS